MQSRFGNADLQLWGQLKLYQMSQEQLSVYLLWTEKDMVDANQRDSLQSQDAPVTHF